MEEFGGQVAAHSVRHTLPAQPTPLIGREGELDAAKARLLQAEVRLLTLTGPGGTGKTRLALAVAGELVDEFGDGVVFIDLSALHEPALVASSILQALAVPESGETPFEALARALHSRHQLLVLDNFEQLLSAAPLLAELLAGCPKLKLLVTSRAALKLRWEHLFPVPPLAVPDPARLLGLDALRGVPAVALLVRRARAVQPEFALTPENASAIATIYHRLDGLPLALELAAPRLKLFGPRELLGRLERRLEGLSAHASDLPTRQRTLHAEMDWSYGLLTEAERTLFRRLGVFVGGFSAEAALAVCGDTGVDVLEGLGALVDQSLLRVEGADGEARFGMLLTLREFALNRLADHPQEKLQVEERHGRYYLHFLQSQGEALGRLEQREALGALEEDHGNVRQAWEWAVRAAQVGEISPSAAALCAFHDMSGRYWEGIAVLESALEGLGEAEHADAIGHLLAARAWLYKGLGDYEQAAELAERSLELLRSRGAGWAIVTALSGLAFVLSAKGNFSGAKG